MENNQEHGIHPNFFLFNWHFAAKIALVIAAISCLAAVLVLNYIASSAGQNYTEVARYFNSSRHGVGPAVLVAGLILVSFASVITWLIALYTSFYIAGPLFRFARNFEALIELGPTSLIPTRKTDRLKLEEQMIKRSVLKLQQHYSNMRAIAGQALSQSGSQQVALIEKLRVADREVRL